MGIRTLLSRTASGVALPPVQAFEAAASTARVPVTLAAALRDATADLRQRLTPGRRPTVPTADGPSAAPGLAGSRDLAAVLGLAGHGDLPAVLGLTDPPAATGHTPTQAPPPARPRSPAAPGRASRLWSRLVRDYLLLVLTLLPRPRPAHTTITVYITTSGGPLSERQDGSAPDRRRGQDPQGPEPDAAP
ncbi:hypothetical protein [Streptomyces sp. NPDC002788]